VPVILKEKGAGKLGHLAKDFMVLSAMEAARCNASHGYLGTTQGRRKSFSELLSSLLLLGCFEFPFSTTD
jgi:hypothetical protein